MDKTEVIERLEEALAEVNEIDLRGRRRGTPIHTAVTIAQQSLTEALDLVEAEDGR